MKLPGIGPKAANRIVLYLLKNPPASALELARGIENLHASIRSCSLCFRMVDQEELREALCSFCRDPLRDGRTICVIAETLESQTIESTGVFHGCYHVLGGLLDPLEGITGDHLTIAQLVRRVRDASPSTSEVILALNADMRGETTALYIKQCLEPQRQQGVRITKLARGLPTSALIEYADELTLTDAIVGRTPLK